LRKKREFGAVIAVEAKINFTNGWNISKKGG
jgi:hypothetical protein